MGAEQGAGGTWPLWAMLAVGVILVLVSLRQTSERFWHWKRARQVQAGEVTPAETVLYVGQSLVFTMPDIPQENASSGRNSAYPEGEQTARGDYTSKPQAHVTALSRGLLWFALDSEAATGFQSSAGSANSEYFVPRAGQMLTFTITGEDALYRFEARVRETRRDPAHAGVTLACIKLPFWLAQAQRRRYARVPLRLRATFRPVCASPTAAAYSASAPADVSLRGTLLDLSGGGLRVEVEGAQSPNAIARLCEQLPVGTILEITLDAPRLRAETLRVQVRDMRRVAVRGGLGLRLRGEFMNLPARQRATLAGMVFQAQRDQRQNQTPRIQTAI